MKREFFEIEKIIGYSFKDDELLLSALTHPSYGNERNMTSYERLEFVGDSIVDFIIADELYKRFENADEGSLSKMRAGIVSREPLANIVKRNGFDEYILIGGGRELGEKELSNIFESLVGAIFYDGGIDKAREFILKFASELINSDDSTIKDYKSELQNVIQKRKLKPVEYSVVSHERLENNSHRYVVEARADGKRAVGEGHNRQEGEKEAARKLLELIFKNK